MEAMTTNSRAWLRPPIEYGPLGVFFAAYVMAIAMVLVIVEGVVSVLHTVYTNISQPPFFIIPDFIQTFGASDSDPVNLFSKKLGAA